MSLEMRLFFFFKQKTAYEMRISDWSSDVCSSDLSDVAICWPRNSKREISAPAVARASEMTLMAASIRDIAAAAEAAELTATEAMLSAPAVKPAWPAARVWKSTVMVSGPPVPSK